MQHLIKKISLIGAGGGGGSQEIVIPEPPPATLQPPKLGKYSQYASYSQAEIVDLLCDGPIHGLTAPDGKSIKGLDVLQGIYLDDNQVAIGSATQSLPSTVFNSFANLGTILKDVSASIEFNQVGSWETYYRQHAFKEVDGCDADKLEDDAYRATEFKNIYPGTAGSIQNVAQTVEWKTSLSACQAQYWPRSKNWALTKMEQFSPNLSAKGWVFNSTTITRAAFTAVKFPGQVYPGNLHYFSKTIGAQQTEIHIYKQTVNAANTILNQKITNFNSLQTNAAVTSQEKTLISQKSALITTLINENIGTDIQVNPFIATDGNIKSAGNFSLLVINFGTRESPTNIGIKTGSSSSALKAGSTTLLDPINFYVENASIPQDIFVDGIVPILNSSLSFTGAVYGFVAIKLPIQQQITKSYYDNRLDQKDKVSWNYAHAMWLYNFLVDGSILTKMALSTGLAFTKTAVSNDSVKYNYNNILAEIRYGTKDQPPLSFFEKMYIDREYKSRLYGPFRSSGQIARLTEKVGMVNPTDILSPQLSGGTMSLSPIANMEGSLDSAGREGTAGSTKAYHWLGLASEYDEIAVPFTHIIENPEVDSVIISVLIAELIDTLTIEMDIEGNNGTNRAKYAQAGTKIPAVARILIETGIQKLGVSSNQQTYQYDIYGLIPQQVIIDFGNPENISSKYNFIKMPAQNINKPFVLPTLGASDIATEAKRYVKVYKVSTETNSVLVRKEIYIHKITEILKNKFSHPFSAVIGMKIDARGLSSVPSRSFDCRLKLVKIPNNYNIFENGYDVRYQKTVPGIGVEKNRIYTNDWDGQFKMGWTDNPAWILYDILINKRYGLGQYIDESDINAWELYKIGRYCDAVDDDGFFQGVPDGNGGLEPRFSCNVMFSDSTKLLDVVSIISNLFRGSVFFGNGEVHFVDDRPREATALFNNSNVKDGFFNYVTNKKEDIFNTVEVAYLDRFDNFKTKVELIEDFDDIRSRGVHRTVVNTIGVTSKAMAKRIGKHIIWQTIRENQGVEFIAGLESLLCKPGDLILIEDDLKSRTANCGKILAVDQANKTLILNNPYDPSNFNGYIDIYTPTGIDKNEINSRATSTNRGRVRHFTVSNSPLGYSALNTQYFFSGYIGNNAAYIGENANNIKTYCFYDDSLSGWIFSTGFAFTQNNLYNLILSENSFVRNSSSNNPDNGNGNLTINQIESGYKYNIANQRSTTPTRIYNNLTFPDSRLSLYGVLDDEIRTQGYRQLTKYKISNAIPNTNDGSIITLDSNNFNLNLLEFVKEGSPYRIGIKNNQDSIYKVISIREENQNEYGIVATKYDSGKWSAIENDIIIENPQQIFSSTAAVTIQSLATPTNLSITISSINTSQFSATISFTSTHNKFEIILENKAVGYYEKISTPDKTATFNGLNNLGKYELTVQAMATTSSQLNSYPAKFSKFIGYESSSISTYDRPFISKFTLI